MKNLAIDSWRQFLVAGASALAVASLIWISPTARADNPPPSRESLRADYEKQYGVMQDLLSDPSVLTDATQRTATAPKVIPVLKNLLKDSDGLITADPDFAEEATDRRAEFVIFLSLFGDPDASKTIATEAQSDVDETAVEGKRSQLMVSWLTSSQDTNAQVGIADQIEKLGKDHIVDQSLTMQMMEMSKLGCSTPELAKRLQGIVTDVMKNDLADSIKQQAAAGQKLATLENKPLTIAGKQPDGKSFTTADWKGKVILVDFWATWCGPCREELPRVSKLYADYHAKGLEVLGVSNDFSADDLSKFLGEHKEMPWPQLLDANAAQNQQWNPITTGFGIDGIPTMFLIDKKGVCRTVSARENMEDLIPKLLAE
jgi:thiol-disulfide isomerase/thioredoxin